MNEIEVFVRGNWERVNESILKTCVNSGPQTPKIIVVTKKQPIEVIQAVLNVGAKYLGENYPEEAAGKMDLLPSSGVEWHMIGHIQSRKSELVAERFDFAHSVDRLKVANKLSARAVEMNKVLPILLECNVSGESSKSGYPVWQDEQFEVLLDEIEILRALPGISIQGLMTMPPYDLDPETTRPYFARLRVLMEKINKQLDMSLAELSMGTSFDYLVAIQEGATFVRIGTAITGERKY